MSLTDQRREMEQLISNFEQASRAVDRKKKIDLSRLVNDNSIIHVCKRKHDLLVYKYFGSLENFTRSLEDELVPGELLSPSSCIFHGNLFMKLPIRISQTLNKIHGYLESLSEPVDLNEDQNTDLIAVTSNLIRRHITNFEYLMEVFPHLFEGYKIYLDRVLNKSSEGLFSNSWKEVMVDSHSLLDTIGRLNNQGRSPVPNQGVKFDEVVIDEVVYRFLPRFDEACKFLDNLNQHRDPQECCLEVVKAPREDYEKVASEYLPALRSQVVSLTTEFCRPNLAHISSYVDDSKWRTIFDLPVLSSTSMTKALTLLDSFVEDDGLANVELVGSDLILIPKLEYNFVSSNLSYCAGSVKCLMTNFITYLRGSFGPSRQILGWNSKFSWSTSKDQEILPSKDQKRLLSEISRESKDILKSIDVVISKLSEIQSDYRSRELRSTPKDINGTIEPEETWKMITVAAPH